MRKVSGTACWQVFVLVALSWAGACEAAAQTTYYNATAQQGIYLPPVPAQNGFDEVRGADGTSCRSSMGNNGAFFDAGAIANESPDGGTAGGMVYGRIVVPLGERPHRIDCSRLYELEIKRLQHELQIARMGGGMVQNSTTADNATAPSWQTEGWTTKARRVDGSEIGLNGETTTVGPVGSRLR